MQYFAVCGEAGVAILTYRRLSKILLLNEMSGSSTGKLWTPEHKLALAQSVCKRKGYIKTLANFKDKYQLVIDDLKASALDFAKITLSFPSIQNTFIKHSRDVLEELGISSEGANLSGLASSPSEYQKLHMNMAEEVDKFTTQKNETKEKKKKKKEKNLLTHERTGLLKQSNAPPSASNSDATTSPSDASGDSDGAGPTPPSNGRPVPKNPLASTNDSVARMQAALAGFSNKRQRTEEDPVIKHLVQANTNTAEMMKMLATSVTTLTALMTQTPLSSSGCGWIWR
jgi:hypothetical protein